jgi:hypothetical protein
VGCAYLLADSNVTRLGPNHASNIIDAKGKRMDFIDEWLRYLTGNDDAPPSTATTLYDLVVP